MIPQKIPKFVLLAILDGWGIAPDGPGNAITQASTPNMRRFMASYPSTQLVASGKEVGLPAGEDGNTETGHLNMGAGRVVYQDLERINVAIAEGSFFTNKTLTQAFDHAKKNNSNLHLMGLIGAGGTHSSIQHLYALIQLAGKLKFKKLFLHLFTDGRDSPPKSSITYISSIEKILNNEGVGKIATVMGRYWAMDRDQRWQRTEKAYLALTKGEAHKVKNPIDAIENSYSIGVTDEFIEPSCVVDTKDNPIGLIKDNDSLIFFNFRIDRPRQLSMAFVLKNFTKASQILTKEKETLPEYINKKLINDKDGEPFNRGELLKNLNFVTMTKYSDSIVTEGAKVAFPPEIVEMPLGGVISVSNFTQLRVTESEKERFVTFYFNGLRETPFPLEERVIVPSDKIATYDLKPEMSSAKITEILEKKLKDSDYKLIVANYPNADMVGHTGNFKATIKAVEAIDVALGRLANLVLSLNGTMLITADHGNAEEMINLQTNEMDTEHSTNPVPFIVINKFLTGKPTTLTSGILADIAPTILSILEISIPSNMTGRNLLQGF